ncbi:hypothetical protein [Nocardioides montaniterrae]
MLVFVTAVVLLKISGHDEPAVAPPPEPAYVAPTSQPSALPTPLGSVVPSTLECNGGQPGLRDLHGPWMTGGGLRAPSMIGQGYRYSPSVGVGFTFLTDSVGTARTVAKGWISSIVVGTLPRANGFTRLERSARAVIACLANDPTGYSGAYRLVDRGAHAIRVDGHRAFIAQADILVKEPGLTVPGDRVRAVVVDTGNRRGFGLFLVATPVGDAPGLRLQKRLVAQLRLG